MSPVRVGEELEVKIEAVGEKGDGIAKKNGFVLFVPNTKEGDEVRIRVTKVFRKVGFAEVLGAKSETESSETEETASEDFGEEPKEPQAEEDQPTEDSSDDEEFGEEDSQ